jgi:hypothetical protein
MLCCHSMWYYMDYIGSFETDLWKKNIPFFYTAFSAESFLLQAFTSSEARPTGFLYWQCWDQRLYNTTCSVYPSIPRPSYSQTGYLKSLRHKGCFLVSLETSLQEAYCNILPKFPYLPYISIQLLNSLTPELNPSAQRCLTRFFMGILLLEPRISLIYAWKTNKCYNYSFSLLIMYGSSYMFRHYIAILRKRS